MKSVARNATQCFARQVDASYYPRFRTGCHMHDLILPWPPLLLMRGAVAAVWLYEGLWCKVIGRALLQAEVVAAVPKLGPLIGPNLLRVLGIVEVTLAVWVMSGIAPGFCAVAQTLLLIAFNTGGLLWPRRTIHDPAGMVVKNIAFLVLAWTCAALAGGRP